MGNIETAYPITEEDVNVFLQEKKKSGEELTDTSIDELMERGYHQQLHVAVKREINSRLQEKSWTDIVVTDDDIKNIIKEKGENISDADFDDYVQMRFNQSHPTNQTIAINDDPDNLC
ncbi:hypothetical protein QLL95_gp0310 [Cotonvirus japonicus]|uniref:Uncharacterized protein n=1 Tax=Cotonvirus japonicus TaxID=2811091 RepID=A0ABM7NRL9_9VIRU|nr:hypothetical protein QLL95_gp0310 [Cotonvirus japonicus]BCS82799.1 hypothetical protein [Cotonvirus japonicus]